MISDFMTIGTWRW